ncbi:MAG: hypothetical protein HHJ09_11145 [Glaciimonas sp.]|nr:hypothetical protein [Glaciimonas sp.]
MNQQSLLKTLDNLRGLPREATTVEFKSNLDQAEEIGQYLSALANSAALEGRDRAWIVWGVVNQRPILSTSQRPILSTFSVC